MILHGVSKEGFIYYLKDKNLGIKIRRIQMIWYMWLPMGHR